MAVPIFPPRRDVDIRTWSTAFAAKITASPTTYGLDAAQATTYQALHDAYAAALARARNASTNSRSAIIAKNDARQALMRGPGGAHELVKIVQARPGTTDAMRGALGLRIPDRERTPIPPPATAPHLSIVGTFARRIKVRLFDQERPTHRSKPIGAMGATVLYHVGDTAPCDPAEWTFARNASKPAFEVDVPLSVEAGSKVWLTAFWFNKRMQPGQAAKAKSTRISEGLARAA